MTTESDRVTQYFVPINASNNPGKTFFFSLKDGDAPLVLRGGQKDPEELPNEYAPLNLNVDTDRILIEEQSICTLSELGRAASANTSGANPSEQYGIRYCFSDESKVPNEKNMSILEIPDLKQGAFGIYEFTDKSDVSHPVSVKVEIYPGKKISRSKNAAAYSSEPLARYNQSTQFFQDMAHELLEESAVYVYGVENARSFMPDFVLNGERKTEPVIDCMFFLTYAEEISRALHAAGRNPHRVLMKEYALEPVERIRRMDARSARTMFSRPADLTPVPNTGRVTIPESLKVSCNRKDFFFPRRMEHPRCVETYDSPENRFIVFVLNKMCTRLLPVLQMLEVQLITEQSDQEKGQKQNQLKKNLDTLSPLKSDLLSFLRRVPFSTVRLDSAKVQFPYRSKVFAERRGYKEIAHLWRIFERCEFFSKNLSRLFSLRRYCDLFELLCFFKEIGEELKNNSNEGQLPGKGSGAFRYSELLHEPQQATPSDSGAPYGCRYEIGENRMVLYNYPIDDTDVRKKTLHPDKKMVFPPGHKRPDIIVAEKDGNSWKIARIVDAKFRRHSPGEKSYDKGCTEIQKYFREIPEALWKTPEERFAKGLFIPGTVEETAFLRTEKGRGYKVFEITLLDTHAVTIPANN